MLNMSRMQQVGIRAIDLSAVVSNDVRQHEAHRLPMTWSLALLVA